MRAVAETQQDLAGDAAHVVKRQAADVAHHLVDQGHVAVALDLAAEVLQGGELALAVHEERQHQLVFRAQQLCLGDAAAAHVGLHDLGELVRGHLGHVLRVVHVARDGEPKEAGVGVGVVEGQAVFHERVLVEHAEEAQEHALARAAGGEGQAAAEELLERGERIQVGREEPRGLERNLHVHELGEVGVARRLVRERELAAGVVRARAARRGVGRAPVAQARGHHGLGARVLHAHHRHHRARRGVEAAVEVHHVRARERGHGLGQPIERHAQGVRPVRGRVERLREKHVVFVH